MFIATIGSISNNFAPNPLLAVSNQTGLQGPTAPYETAGGSNPAEMSDCISRAGDPVNTSTGEFFETATDLSVPGRGPGLDQARTYSSQRAAQDGLLGFGWSSPYGMKAVELSAGGSVQVLQENGSQVTFTPTGSGTYTAPTRVLAALVHNADGTWTFTRKSREIFTFSAAGWLTKISDLNANAVTLTYDTAGKLASVSDSQARTLTFGYGTNGKMATATDPAGRTTSYAYDGAGRLASVTAPGGGVTQYGYDAGNLLTSTTDPRGYTTVNTYDAARRVTKQTTAAGDLLLSYGADTGDALTTITSPGREGHQGNVPRRAAHQTNRRGRNRPGGHLDLRLRPIDLRPQHRHRPPQPNHLSHLRRTREQTHSDRGRRRTRLRDLRRLRQHADQHRRRRNHHHVHLQFRRKPAHLIQTAHGHQPSGRRDQHLRRHRSSR